MHLNKRERGGVMGKATNKILPTECVHVRSGTMEAGESITLTTLGERDPDFRYTKGPDTMRVCLFCAGRLLAALLDKAIIGTRDERAKGAG